MKDFSLLLKQFYCIVWSVGKIQKLKLQKFQRWKTDEQCFYQNVQCVIVKNWNLLKEQEASGLLISLGIKTPLSKILLVGPPLF